MAVRLNNNPFNEVCGHSTRDSHTNVLWTCFGRQIKHHSLKLGSSPWLQYTWLLHKGSRHRWQEYFGNSKYWMSSIPWTHCNRFIHECNVTRVKYLDGHVNTTLMKPLSELLKGFNCYLPGIWVLLFPARPSFSLWITVALTVCSLGVAYSDSGGPRVSESKDIMYNKIEQVETHSKIMYY